MNKRYCIDVREVPIENKKKKVTTNTTKPFSIEMFILAVIVSIFLFPDMWRELRTNNYKTDSTITRQK